MRTQMSLRSNCTYNDKDNNKFRLHHAVLGRYLGGGIAFIDSVCDNGESLQFDYGIVCSSYDRSHNMYHVSKIGGLE